MLKLEKNFRNQDITICLLGRERFLSRTMLQALSIAIFLHFTAAQVFHIKLFHFDNEHGILPSTLVESDVDNKIERNQSISSQVDEEKLPLRFLLEPINSIPFIPPLTLSTPIKNIHLNNEILSSKNRAITENMVSSHLNAATKSMIHRPISIHLSGDLSNKKIISDSSKEIFDAHVLPEFSSFLYQVQVDGSSGRIFWYELTSKNQSPLTPFAEQILNHIILEPEENSFIHSGEIEIVLRKVS